MDMLRSCFRTAVLENTAFKTASKCSFTSCKLRFFDYFCLIFSSLASYNRASSKRNRYFRWFLPLFASLFLGFSATVFGQVADVDQNAKLSEVVNYHRQIIFLLDQEGLRIDVKTRDTFIARNFYFQKQSLLGDYEEVIYNDPARRQAYIDEVLRFVSEASLRPADKLAFIDLVDAIMYMHSESPMLNTRQLGRLQQLEQEMLKIQQAYADKLKEIHEKLLTRGQELETWEAYLAFLQKTFDKSDIRQHFNQTGSILAAPATRGSGAVTRVDPNLIWGGGIPEKTVVLTFDDGPHYRHTDTILDTLKEYGAHAYFFAVGKNFGTVKDGKPALKKNADKLKRALKEGHLLGNHSFSHRVLTKLESGEQKDELANTNALLQLVAGQDNVEFRPPYGSKNDALQQLTVEEGMRSVMWNIDSMDWGDPLPDSIVDRVMARLEKKKRGIILFHDIHKQTVQALPKLLTKLKAEGYSFVTIDGKPFTVAENTASAEIATTAANNARGVDKTPSQDADKTPTKTQTSSFYGNSWAVVIGVNDYSHWPKLGYAVNDAKTMAQTLKDRFGFPEENIFTFYNAEATRDNITEVLGDTLADSRRVKENDRVFIFYAGHGMTRVLPSGRNLGYIIPVDAKLDKFHSRSLSMTHLRDFSEMIPAKHVYYVMDSCYSGIALTRAGAKDNQNTNYLKEIAGRHARQILTAGGADQEVADGGPNGHSIFTWTFLQGLEGLADLDSNGIITASELGAYVAPAVANNSNQTPAFGNLVGSRGGDFIFELPSFSEQQANTKSEKERVNEALLAQQKENLALQQQIAELKRQLENKSLATRAAPTPKAELDPELSPSERRKKAWKLHDAGLALYKQGKYDLALADIKKAMAYNPVNPTIVNNYGFILYKRGQYDEALTWLEKTVELDPKRTVVYLNIADTFIELGRRKESIPYYKEYLKLHPSSPKAEEIRLQLEQLESEG